MTGKKAVHGQPLYVEIPEFDKIQDDLNSLLKSIIDTESISRDRKLQMLNLIHSIQVNHDSIFKGLKEGGKYDRRTNISSE